MFLVRLHCALHFSKQSQKIKRKEKTFHLAPSSTPGGGSRNGRHTGDFQGMHITASIIRGICRISAVTMLHVSKEGILKMSLFAGAAGVFHQLKPTPIINPPTQSALEEGKHLFIGCLLTRRFTSETLLMLPCHFIKAFSTTNQSNAAKKKASIKMIK